MGKACLGTPDLFHMGKNQENSVRCHGEVKGSHRSWGHRKTCISFTYLVPFLLGTEYGRRKSSLLLLMTQRSMLLPDPKSLKMPAAMASLTSVLASSS